MICVYCGGHMSLKKLETGKGIMHVLGQCDECRATTRHAENVPSDMSDNDIWDILMTDLYKGDIIDGDDIRCPYCGEIMDAGRCHAWPEDHVAKFCPHCNSNTPYIDLPSAGFSTKDMTDSDDRTVTNLVKEYWNHEKGHTLHTDNRIQIWLDDIPENERTKKICLEAVTIDGHQLKHAGKFTDDCIMPAINQNAWAIRYVENQTEEQCLAAVDQKPYVLSKCKVLTEKVALTAIKKQGKNNSSLIQYVPKPTTKTIIAAVKLSDSAIWLTKQWTLGAAMYVVKNKPDKIEDLMGHQYTRFENITASQRRKLYIAIVSRDGMQLDEIPWKDRTSDICAAAVAENPDARQFVPESVTV